MMNNNVQRHMSNSGAVTVPDYQYNNRSPLPTSSQYKNETQSASVTLSGSLWHKRLEELANEHTLVSSLYNSDELKLDILQAKKNQALIQLLRSWREGDEQEQRSTLEYLKHAIDEDRTSNRKIFP
jgi:hypothetical protein